MSVTRNAISCARQSANQLPHSLHSRYTLHHWDGLSGASPSMTNSHSQPSQHPGRTSLDFPANQTSVKCARGGPQGATGVLQRASALRLGKHQHLLFLIQSSSTGRVECLFLEGVVDCSVWAPGLAFSLFTNTSAKQHVTLIVLQLMCVFELSITYETTRNKEGR